MRLQRLIAACTELSRRAAEDVITAGRVMVNGQVVQKLGTTVRPGLDRVALDDRLLTLPHEHFYLLLHKPPNFIVTKKDPQGRPTIWSLLKPWAQKLDAAGRLDFDAEGLILLSDDGDFLQKIAHPKHELWKVYHVKVRRKPSAEALQALAKGVKLDDGTMTLPAQVKKLRETSAHSWIEIGIREGKNHQIKRMCEAVGHDCIRLRRVAIGSLKLGGMKPGLWRYLRPDELSRLLQEVG